MIRNGGDKEQRGSQGYSLTELMIVVVIIGIMATQVIFMFTAPDGKVKDAAFALRSDLNLARAEAVKRNADVLVQFLVGATEGYDICVEDPVDNDCADVTDTIIKQVVLGNGVQFYDRQVAAPGGPDQVISGGVWPNPADGVELASGNFLTMQSDGTTADTGGVYVYLPSPNNPDELIVPPFGVQVSGVGMVRLRRWRLDPPAGWSSD